ncbi:DUF2637 domain-containing protein [Streptomyces phaeochromogenes]|uniref:DUF2637 domain-containing protein n=1 Tax=Streptomyces phaeochromogenes TaxID=1923 RepID=UPI002E2A2899|nr:DUF2637 domain-containing protein [Streptomyces phaeochromogenes]
MNKMKYAQWAGFGVVLIVALGISWFSMGTMAMDFFHLPAWIAYAVSVAFDGAAIYVAVLSSEYAKTEDSGLMPRLVTMGMVGVSAWLNFQHASLMGLGLAGQVFFAAPPVIAGILFELFLKFENRKELRKRGKVAKSLPVFGKAAWTRYPTKTFKAASKVVLHRLNEVMKTETQTLDDVYQEDKTIIEDKTPVKTEQKTAAPKKTLKTKTAKELSSEYPDIDQIDADLSINKIVLTLWGGGMRDRDDLVATVSKVKGIEVTKNTVNRSLSRAGLV